MLWDGGVRVRISHRAPVSAAAAVTSSPVDRNGTRDERRETRDERREMRDEK